MTTEEISAALAANRCEILEDQGDFALVYPYGYSRSKRAHGLKSKTREEAVFEAWAFLQPEFRTEQRIDIIQRVTAAEFGLSVIELCGSSRPEPIATARRIAMALAAEITHAGVYQIGALFGGRDHSTASYAKQSVRDQCETSAAFANRYETLKARCLWEFEKGKL